jgi:hypothetical protein
MNYELKKLFIINYEILIEKIYENVFFKRLLNNLFCRSVVWFQFFLLLIWESTDFSRWLTSTIV